MTASEKVLSEIGKVHGVKGAVIFHRNGDVLADIGAKVDGLPVVASFLMDTAGQIKGAIGAERVKHLCFNTEQGDNIFTMRFNSVCLGVCIELGQTVEQVMDRVLKVLRDRINKN